MTCKRKTKNCLHLNEIGSVQKTSLRVAGMLWTDSAAQLSNGCDTAHMYDTVYVVRKVHVDILDNAL